MDKVTLSPAVVTAWTLVSMAALTDLRGKTVPNWLTYTAMGLAALFAATNHQVGAALLGGFLVLIPAVTLFARSALGGGDVKLFVALGLLLGALPALGIFFYSFAIGSAVALVMLARQGRLGVAMRRLGSVLLGVFVPGFSLPKAEPTARIAMRFAPAIALGTLLQTSSILMSLIGARG